MGASVSVSILTDRVPTSVGVDVVSLARIERALTRGVFRTVCHQSELTAVPFEPEHAARVWTAKEAVVKTLGTGFWQAGVDFPEVRIGEDGAVTLHGNAKRLAPTAVFEVEFRALEGALVAIALRYDPIA